MTAPLWNKAGIEIDERIMRFMAGNDVLLDRHLLPFDIQATIVHTQGLADIGAIDPPVAQSIIATLEKLTQDIQAGHFVIDERFEDGHSAIEHYLTEQLGDDGGRVHLGRSRNDQVLVALRLYMKDALSRAASLTLDCAEASLSRAEQHQTDPMPGYTHLQRAVPSSVGLWMASFAEEFTSAAALLFQTRDWIDACPLGTAAGYGVNLDLPRDKATEQLGFSHTLLNPMYAQASRGVAEAQVLSALWQPAQSIRRLAWDLVLFSTSEYGFVTLPSVATTGSSIMPNKRNPDLAELLRGIAPIISGCIAELHAATALPSGYHRDLQHTKAPLIRGINTALGALELIPDMILMTEFHTDRMRAAIDAPMFATDQAVSLAAQGLSFRNAYRQVADSLAQLDILDPDKSIRERISLGATGTLGLNRIAARIEEHRARTTTL